MDNPQERWDELEGTILIPSGRIEGVLWGRGSVEIARDGFLFRTKNDQSVLRTFAILEISLLQNRTKNQVIFSEDKNLTHLLPRTPTSNYYAKVFLKKEDYDAVDINLIKTLNELISLLGQQSQIEYEQWMKTSKKDIGISIPSVTYIGGLSEGANTGVKGSLTISQSGIRMGGMNFKTSEISRILFEGGQVAKRKTGATLAFGMIGAMAGKASTFETVIEVVLKNGESCFFHVPKQAPYAVRAHLTPMLSKMGLTATVEDDETSGESVPAPTQKPDTNVLADQIKELAQLKDDGILTEKEFASAKAKLLS